MLNNGIARSLSDKLSVDGVVPAVVVEISAARRMRSLLAANDVNVKATAEYPAADTKAESIDSELQVSRLFSFADERSWLAVY